MALSETQISILARGHETSPFKLDRSVGRALGKMLDDGLMQPGGKKGEWDLTDKGRAAFATHLAQQAAANDQVYKETESSINLDDPALQPAFEVMDFTASPDAVARVVSENEAYKARIKSLNASLDDMGKLADQLTKKINLLETGQTATTRINWYESLVVPLVAFITQDTSNPAATESLSESPEKLLRWITDTRQSLHNMDEIADERAALIEDRDGTIEALRRCIEELEAKAAHQTGRADVFLAGQILDELCELIPEVEEYRLARENAVKAISSLKAKR